MLRRGGDDRQDLRTAPHSNSNPYIVPTGPEAWKVACNPNFAGPERFIRHPERVNLLLTPYGHVESTLYLRVKV